MEGKIELLKKKDTPEAITLYQKLAKEQIPSMNIEHEDIANRFLANNCYVYKNEKAKITGLVTFCGSPEYNLVELEFVGSSEKKKGIATNLLRKVAEDAKKNDIDNIYAKVSDKDQRAMDFYKSLGFKKEDELSNDKMTLYIVKATPEEILNRAKKVKK